MAIRLDTGRRVVLNPWLWCTPRGIEPVCEACAAGRYPSCRNFSSGDLPVAIHLGNCAGAVGVHGEYFCAHESQLFEVPEEMSDEAGVLADPVSVSLRSILFVPSPVRRPRPCLRLGHARHGRHRAASPSLSLDRDLGRDPAGRPGRPGGEARGRRRVELPARPSSCTRFARRTAKRPLRPWSGKEWLQDGPSVVYDTVASTETVETSLRLLGTAGTLVVSGVEPPGRFEWTPMYFKELRLIGSNGFGLEEVAGVKKHAFEHYFDFARAGLDLTAVVTHRYRLERWREAVLALADARSSGAVKVLLAP